MRILLIHSFYQLRGGEETIVDQELELLRQKHTVETLFFENGSGIAGAIRFLLSVWNIKAALRVQKKIREFKPDVVQLHNWHFGCGPLIIRTIKRNGVAVVHTIHNYRLLCPSAILMHENKLFLESIHSNFPWQAIRNRVYRNSFLQTFWLSVIVWFHKKIGTWKMVDAYSCQTEFAIDLFSSSSLGITKGQFVLKPNFIKRIVTTASDVERKNEFLFIGRLSEEKGIALLLEAFKGSVYTLKIAGDGPLKQLVQEASQTYSNIIYIGLLPKEKIIKELQKAQALVFPSVWYEGMPMTILEAFSTSTPVIASNIGAMSTMIQHHVNGIHFECNSIDSLKAAIAQWMQLTEQEKNRLRSNAFASYQTLYSPEQQLNHFETIYKKVLN